MAVFHKNRLSMQVAALANLKHHTNFTASKTNIIQLGTMAKNNCEESQTAVDKPVSYPTSNLPSQMKLLNCSYIL